MANYLLKRGKLWWVQRKFPVDVKSELGTFFQSLCGRRRRSQTAVGRLAEFDMLVQEVRQTRDAGDLFEAADDQLSPVQMMAKIKVRCWMYCPTANPRHPCARGYGRLLASICQPARCPRTKATVDHGCCRNGRTDSGHEPKRLNRLFDWVIDRVICHLPIRLQVIVLSQSNR